MGQLDVAHLAFTHDVCELLKESLVKAMPTRHISPRFIEWVDPFTWSVGGVAVGMRMNNGSPVVELVHKVADARIELPQGGNAKATWPQVDEIWSFADTVADKIEAKVERLLEGAEPTVTPTSIPAGLSLLATPSGEAAESP